MPKPHKRPRIEQNVSHSSTSPAKVQWTNQRWAVWKSWNLPLSFSISNNCRTPGYPDGNLNIRLWPVAACCVIITPIFLIGETADFQTNTVWKFSAKFFNLSGINKSVLLSLRVKTLAACMFLARVDIDMAINETIQIKRFIRWLKWYSRDPSSEMYTLAGIGITLAVNTA